MAQVATSISAILNYVTLTEPVTKIMNALPKVLPDELYSRTVNVIGNKFRYITFRPTRQPAKMVPYGSPPRQAKQTGAGVEDVVMIHSSEEISAGEEVLELFHEYADYRVQDMAAQELDRRAQDFAVRQQNLRTTAIHEMVAFGKIYFDSNGDLSTTDQSGSGGLTVDYKVPSGNIAAASVDWSSASANLVNALINFLTDAVQAGGGPLRHAICGKNVSQYLAGNTQFQNYLVRERPIASQYIGSGVMPQGSDVLGLRWTFAQNAYFEKADGTVIKVFPDDQITFLPEVTPDLYDLKQGSVPVPKTFMTFASGGDFNTVVRAMLANPIHGAVRFAYGTALPFPKINIVQTDTFFPHLKRANAMFIMDTTP